MNSYHQPRALALSGNKVLVGLPPARPLIESLQRMEIRFTRLKFLILALCGAFTTVAAFGQVTYTFSSTNGADIGLAVSWTPNGLPSGASQDNAQWDGLTAGNLVLNYNTGWGNSGFGTSGINIICTTNQAGSVTITSSGNSPAAGIFGITNNSPSGTLRIGDNTSHSLNLATRPGNAGTIHGFVNNSTSAAIMDSSVIWVAGGGVACVMDFGGTGDWIVNHNLRDNNSGAGPISVNWEGPGTMTWSPGGVFLSSDPLGPITINGGTVVLKGAGLCQSFSGQAAGNNTITNNGTALKYDAVGISDNISRAIRGTGTLQVNNGTLTLSGANTYTGTTLLSGGELIVGVAENFGTSGPLGVGGTISFTGGTLGFNAVNTYDYSPRFDTNANQAYRFDTAGLSVLLTNDLSSSGGTLTKLGSGTLTLSGTCSYSGLTAVGAGKLVFQGSKTGSGNITVSNSTTLSVAQGGAQMTPATLTVGTSSSAILEFNNVNNTGTAAILAGTISAGGTITVNVTSGSFTIGQSYPLFSWTGGPAPAVTLGTLTGAVGNLSTNGNTIQLNVTSLAFLWTGVNNGNWDTSTPNNWKVNGVAQSFANGGTALFDDSATGQTNVTLNSPVSPASVTVNSSTKTYSITSSGANVIGGAGSLTKNGNSVLTLSGGVNTYSGPTILSGGTLSVSALANGGSASDIGAASSSAANLVFNGGALQYTNGGTVSSDHSFTLGTAGGTIDASGFGALALNNSGSVALSGSGARVLTLTGSLTDTNTLAAVLSDNGGPTSLTKNGTGTWVLTGNNTNSGTVTIAAGTLQVGTGGASGSLGTGNVVDNGILDFNVSGTLTIGTISGSGSLINDGSGTLILPGNNIYAGGTTINNGTVQVGTGGATGQLDSIANIANNGTIIFNSTSDSTISGVISGTGQLIKRGSGLLKFIGNNTYTGTTTVDSGAQLQLTQGNTGQNASPAIINNGTVITMRQDNSVFTYAGNISGTGSLVVEVSNGNAGDSTLTGSNTYTGGTYILGGGLIIGNNGLTPNSGSIIGNVFMTNDIIHATFGPFVPATIAFNRAEDVTFPGNIVGEGSLTQQGSGRLTLTGNNTYTNGTTISGGILQIGAGGTIGSAGTGPIVDNSELDFNRSDSVTLTSVISGGGSVVQLGAGTVTLAADNTYSGTTTVSNGTLFINGNNIAAATMIISGTLGGTGTLFGPVTLNAGTTLAPGASAGSVGTLTINSDLSIGGNLAIDVNKSLPLTNDLVVVGGVLTNAGTGTLTVANLGPALTAGDKFTLFSEPVLNGAAFTVTGGGVNWTNNLAVDGSITAGSAISRPTLNFTNVGGNSLRFSWTGSFKLQVQTNSINVGLGTNWVNYPGGGTSPVIVPADATKGAVFFRLAPTP